MTEQEDGCTDLASTQKCTLSANYFYYYYYPRSQSWQVAELSLEPMAVATECMLFILY